MRLLLVSYGYGISRVSNILTPEPDDKDEITSEMLRDCVVGSGRYFEYVRDVKTGSVILMTEDGVVPGQFELMQFTEDRGILCRAILVHGSRRFKTRLRNIMALIPESDGSV